MDLRQLGYVVGIVDHGGFTRAARALHVAQPSLSQAVRALEVELGVELFDRRGRTVVLTAAGDAILEPARQALRDAEVARAAVAAVGAVAGGHLDIACLPTLAVAPVADLIGRFRRAHPGVSIRLAEPEDVHDVPDHVRDGRSELGFAELPTRHVGLVTHELEAHDYVVVVPRSMADVSDSVRLSDVADLPLVTTMPGTSTRRLVDEAFHTSGLTPTIAVETDHREVITALVRAGAGISILPRPVAERIARLEARLVELTPRIVRRIGLVHRDGPLSPAARAFVAVTLGPPA